MKETFYFVHDYHARHDIKLEAVFADFGLEGIGAYWCIVEMLYEENGYLKLSLCERIATALRTHYDLISKLIDNYSLFEKDDQRFWSNSILRRLEERKEKSEKARISVNKRWSKYERNTNVYDSNTIKESKVKEKKVNIPIGENSFPSTSEPSGQTVDNERTLDGLTSLKSQMVKLGLKKD